MCVACTSVQDHPGFLSSDSNCIENAVAGSDIEPVVYKSSQYPDSADDFSHVRQACVKSLSNEVRSFEKGINSGTGFIFGPGFLRLLESFIMVC